LKKLLIWKKLSDTNRLQHGRSRRRGRAPCPSRCTPPPPTRRASPPTISCSKMFEESGYRIKTLQKELKSDVNVNKLVNRSKHRQIYSCKVLLVLSSVLLLLCSGNIVLHVRAEDLIHHHGAHQRVCSHQHPKAHEVGHHFIIFILSYW